MNEPFHPQQSLALIQSMIDKTKANIANNRVYFLFWGWLSFACIIGQFLLKVVLEYRHHYYVWFATVVGIVFTVLYSRKTQRRQRVRTYIDDAMGFLWSGMAAAFAILSFIITFLPVTPTGWVFCYPFFILLYGLGTFVSGKILQFRPLVIGGAFNWLLACAAVFFDFDYQLLFAAGAILTSYIIPGHLLQKQKTATA